MIDDHAGISTLPSGNQEETHIAFAPLGKPENWDCRIPKNDDDCKRSMRTYPPPENDIVMIGNQSQWRISSFALIFLLRFGKLTSVPFHHFQMLHWIMMQRLALILEFKTVEYRLQMFQ
jgi:hypothetical protein